MIRSTMAALALCLIAGSLIASDSAAQIPEDFFSTASGIDPGGTRMQFGTPTFAPLPSDFFGPGSDPFEGHVAFKGVPHDPSTWGDASMILLRDAQPIVPPAPVGTYAEIQIEIVALNLASTEPITVTYFGGTMPELWDVTVGPSVVPPLPGVMAVTKTHANGGVFDAFLPIQYSFEFRRVSDGSTVTLDMGLESMPPLDLFANVVPWVHAADPALDLIAFSNGDFVPCVEEVIPGDPASQCPTRLYLDEPLGSVLQVHDVARPLPLPDPLVVIPGDEPDGCYLPFDVPSNPPIPADFFGPGSDPFDGIVALHGAPIAGLPGGYPPATETLILRHGDPFDRCEIPSPEVRTVEIEILELGLEAIDPIWVTYEGGAWSEEWLFWVYPSPSVPQYGTLAVTKTHENGGIFTSEFYFQPLYQFYRISDGTLLELDLGGYEPRMVFAGLDGHWVHDRFDDLPVYAPSDGRFVLGVEEVLPGDPATQEARRLHCDELGGAGRLTFAPAPYIPGHTPDRSRFALQARAYPNPFNPSTLIEVAVPASDLVKIEIYDLRGGLVKTLFDEVAGGVHSVGWDGTDARGRAVSAGVYCYTASWQGETVSGKVALVK